LHRFVHITSVALNWTAVRAMITVLAVAAVAAPAAARAEVVEVTRTAVVYKKPAISQRELRGKVQAGSRFEVLEQKRGKGCKGKWLRIDDRAWICGARTKTTDDEPGGRTLPQLSDGEIVPHTYVLTQDARVYATLDDAVSGDDEDTIPGLGGFRVRAVRSKGGRTFVRVSEGWVPRADVRYAKPSDLKAVPLDAAAAGSRLGFVRARDGAERLDANGKPLGGDAVPVQTFLDAIGEPVTAGGDTLYPIGDGVHLRANDVGLVVIAAPPDEVTGDDERWLDVDLSEQTLVAYEGATPVRATMVSTARTATPTGVFHIYKKRAVSFMKSKPEHRNKYNLDTPWVMTLKGRIAMHAVYWHDEFGTARSHGCVNLAPQDAKWIWDWTLPAVPEGWLRVDTAEPDEGTVVRIRK
jgi:hypothetical protein